MIGIIDYGASNTQSVMNALSKLEIPYFLSNNPTELSSADRLILPGVGHARTALKTILRNSLADFIINESRPLLGICLGMQLLCEWSEEGNTECLGIADGNVKLFDSSKAKVPAMGWNQLKHSNHALFKNIEQDSYFYFVHSYYVPKNAQTIASATYGLEYAATIQKDNFYGVQFHPEKSGKVGLQLLKNFNQIKQQ